MGCNQEEIWYNETSTLTYLEVRKKKCALFLLKGYDNYWQIIFWNCAPIEFQIIKRNGDTVRYNSRLYLQKRLTRHVEAPMQYYYSIRTVLPILQPPLANNNQFIPLLTTAIIIVCVVLYCVYLTCLPQQNPTNLLRRSIILLLLLHLLL